MYARRLFLLIAGIAALGAGFALAARADFGSWFNLIAGTLLWLLGCVLVICWAAERIYAAGPERAASAKGPDEVRFMKKAS